MVGSETGMSESLVRDMTMVQGWTLDRDTDAGDEIGNRFSTLVFWRFPSACQSGHRDGRAGRGRGLGKAREGKGMLGFHSSLV